MPAEGDLILEFPPDPRAKQIVNPGVLYTNNGTDSPPAVLGTLTVDPKYVSYADGFFARTAGTDGCRLTDVLFGVPPHVRARLDERLSAL